jgi:hypothetical protein
MFISDSRLGCNQCGRTDNLCLQNWLALRGRG